ncbi:MAG: hypothetical protein NC307_01590 [Roseburia sp.]|nr:hypothetical protein [Roseburia sp.]
MPKEAAFMGTFVAASEKSSKKRLLRYDVLEQAAQHKNILFPIFTNGTFLHKNLFRIPSA